MPIRVISGTAKGRRLKLVPGDTTRPIMDRVKEALFSIIGYDIVDATFIDLFSGTGSVGIEALSRGARKVVFVELARPAVRTIQANLEITKLTDNALIRKADVLELLKQPAPIPPYDFIYIAPPQYKELWLATLQTLDDNPDWIGEDTTVIVQIDPSEHKDVEFNYIELQNKRRYGKTMLCFYYLKNVNDNVDEEDEDANESH